MFFLIFFNWKVNYNISNLLPINLINAKLEKLWNFLVMWQSAVSLLSVCCDERPFLNFFGRFARGRFGLVDDFVHLVSFFLLSSHLISLLSVCCQSAQTLQTFHSSLVCTTRSSCETHCATRQCTIWWWSNDDDDDDESSF